MLVELAASYIKVINDGHVPVIENIWTSVQKTEQERAYQEARTFFKSKSRNLESSQCDIKKELK
jgi:hypothetical protein